MTDDATRPVTKPGIVTYSTVPEILAAERTRIAHALVPVAREMDWCNQVLLAWRVAYGDDVPEPRDADGVSVEGWTLDPDGKTESEWDLGRRTQKQRPVRPSLRHMWLWDLSTHGFTWQEREDIKTFVDGLSDVDDGSLTDDGWVPATDDRLMGDDPF